MRSVVVVVIGALALGACQDSAGPADGGLTRAEALGIALLVAASSEGAAGTSLTAAGGADSYGPPVDFTHTHQSTHPCPSGGIVDVAFTVTGTFDADSHSLQADIQGTQTHASCAFRHNGRTFTVSGSPALDFAASLGAANGQPTQPFSHSVSGAFSWSASDGRSGTCLIDLAAVTDLISRQRTVEGSVCGHTVRQTTTWS